MGLAKNCINITSYDYSDIATCIIVSIIAHVENNNIETYPIFVSTNIDYNILNLRMLIKLIYNILITTFLRF